MSYYFLFPVLDITHANGFILNTDISFFSLLYLILYMLIVLFCYFTFLGLFHILH